MGTGTLTKEEQLALENWKAQVGAGEIAQVQDLIANCNVSFQFAKTYSVYVKDWEKTKVQMESKLKSGALPPGVSANLHRAIIDASEEIMQRKFTLVREAFQQKFGESIDNYTSTNKKRGFLGLFG